MWAHVINHSWDIFVREFWAFFGRSLVFLSFLLGLYAVMQPPYWFAFGIGFVICLGIELVYRIEERIYFAGLILGPFVSAFVLAMFGWPDGGFAYIEAWILGNVLWVVVSWLCVYLWPAFWRGGRSLWYQKDFDAFVEETIASWRLEMTQVYGFEAAAAFSCKVQLVVYEAQFANRTGVTIDWRTWGETFPESYKDNGRHFVVERWRALDNWVFLGVSRDDLENSWIVEPLSAHDMMALMARVAAEPEVSHFMQKD